MLREIIQGALTRFMEEKISRVAITPAIDAPLLVLGHELICDLSPLTATAVPRAIEREREREPIFTLTYGDLSPLISGITVIPIPFSGRMNRKR